jgi:AcrR family transcriptional regulator
VGTREAKKADKLQRIEAAAREEFLAVGSASATVDRIVARAGVARGTFYLYYPDKDALFAALIGRVREPLMAAVDGAAAALAAGAEPMGVYAQFGAALAAVIVGDPDGARLLLREARSGGAGGDLARATMADVEGLVQRILDDAVARGLLRPHDTRAVALAICGGVERLTAAWLEPRPGAPALRPEAVTVELIGLFTWGLAAGRA